MTIRALATTFAILVADVGSAHAGMFAVHGGASFPVGAASDFLSNGYSAALSYDWPVGAAMLGFETGFSSWNGTGSYEAYLGQGTVPPTPSIDYRLDAIPVLFVLKAPISDVPRTIPYLTGGLGVWRLTEKLYGFEQVHTDAALQLGVGLSRALSDQLEMGVEGLYQVIGDFMPRIAPTSSSTTQLFTLRAYLGYGGVRTH